MGTHAKGPSKISHPQELAGQMLSDWLKTNQWALGGSIAATYKGELPFLFKVLSINKALSIQAHPAKAHAELLHRTHPELYKDPNHKPELAIAISEFEGFCGFRPFGEIQGFVCGVPELRELVGEGVCDRMKETTASTGEEQRGVLKEAFTALMESEEKIFKKKLGKLVERLQQGRNGKVVQSRLSFLALVLGPSCKLQRL
jgi:mannose-6-phosphate isomerase